MSQIVTRKGPVGDDKEKRQTDSPVKDMKKKIAANAEKEKQAAEKPAEKCTTTSDKNGENSDMAVEKKEKDKSVEKVDKKESKSVEKADKKEKDKGTEKVDKKEKEKSADKKERAPEKSPKKEGKVEKKEEKTKEDKEKNAKVDHKEDEKKSQSSQQNGARLNGEQNGDTVSSEEDDLGDEMFPELAYDDSDGEFERPTPEGLPSRSHTRRSQVKAVRTPETPRPASDKRVEPASAEESKEKVLKLKEDVMTDRKLRSSASPKPEKIAKKTDSTRKEEEKKEERPMEIEVVIELDNEDEARKPDTNYSRSRVKVSPYRRSRQDVTCSSTAANYTGNNTTMETDITESSFVSEAPDSPYLSGLRTIRGRRSYKPLKEMNLRNIVANRSTRSTASLTVNEPVRPTGTVVGRKRKPDSDEPEQAEEAPGDDVVGGVESKRPRLLHRLARPFRTLAAPRHAEIVGINTDLPLTAPVACADFDPEVIKAEEPIAVAAPAQPIQTTARPSTHDRQDPKRCVIV